MVLMTQNLEDEPSLNKRQKRSNSNSAYCVLLEERISWNQTPSVMQLKIPWKSRLGVASVGLDNGNANINEINYLKCCDFAENNEFFIAECNFCVVHLATGILSKDMHLCNG